MQSKKPMIKESVGALYYAFNNGQNNVYDGTRWEETVKSEIIKKITRTENGDSIPVKASGIDYMTVSQTSSEEIQVEVVAFSADDLAKLRAEIVDNGGLISSGRTAERPFIALGFPVLKTNNEKRYVWYPKCQLVENTDEIATKEESFSEQNDTLTFKAYAFNDSKDIKNYVDTEATNFPEGLTEEKFFTKPILTPEDLEEAITPSQTDPEGA